VQHHLSDCRKDQNINPFPIVSGYLLSMSSEEIDVVRHFIHFEVAKTQVPHVRE
jgi:hypothetical protein